MSDATIRIEGARIALRDAMLDDLDRLAHWLQTGHRWKVKRLVRVGPPRWTR